MGLTVEELKILLADYVITARELEKGNAELRQVIADLAKGAQPAPEGSDQAKTA